MIKKTFKILETERLTLRKIEVEDAKKLYNNIFNDFEYHKFYYQLPFNTYLEYENLIKKYQELYLGGNLFMWAITKKSNDEVIGIVLLHTKDKLNNSCKIGFTISKRERKKGYAKEAVKEVINFGFKILNFHRIEANIYNKNLDSINLVKSVGMYYEGTKKDSYKVNDKYYDQDVYTLINE